MPTVHLIIKGKVQGVFYRASARTKAEEIGISGWVKNTADGSVEAMATGTTSQLEKFISWCERGPSGAVVAGVEVNKHVEQHFSGFKIVK